LLGHFGGQKTLELAKLVNDKITLASNPDFDLGRGPTKSQCNISHGDNAVTVIPSELFEIQCGP
jgi:hypothetical protein